MTFPPGSRVLIKNNPPWPGRIVEHRGPLGPGGADVYRVRLDGGTEIEVREDQLEAVGGRDRTADLDTLADHVIHRLEDGGDSHWGLDGKRPLGSCSPDSDALCLLGIEPEDDGEWTAEQVEYGEGLWADLIPHIQARWSAFREAGFSGDSQSESID